MTNTNRSLRLTPAHARKILQQTCSHPRTIWCPGGKVCTTCEKIIRD